jgi:hypothetical protein
LWGAGAGARIRLRSVPWQFRQVEDLHSTTQYLGQGQSSRVMIEDPQAVPQIGNLRSMVNHALVPCATTRIN